ncbi:MAG: FecR family protein [Methylacidiphilales bacterium]|nr:FecR family protein [Candidatus Methylacidiphilales bacterium]
MHHVIRFTLILLFAIALRDVAWAKTSPTAAPKEVEYRRADTNFYWKGDVLKADPEAVIFTGKYTQQGDSYFITPKVKAPKELYIPMTNDWIEPITPSNMPASLNIPPDAMQIREPHGDVTVALPTAPANFVPVNDGMTIPNGSVVKTGGDGTAAVLFGGVDSARLIPNSEAAVQQTVTEASRSTEVDLTKGAVFSKVGQRIGEKEDYQVKTEFGVAAARGTDFVTVAMPARTDVWIAQGTVQLSQPDGKLVGTVKSDGGGPLKIIRFPVIADPHQAMLASAETMTAAFNFIPMANIKIKALRDQMAQGVKLTPTEQNYLSRIKKVPCLIHLVLVQPPPPAPAPAPLPVPAMKTGPAPAPAPVPGAAAPAPMLKPINLHLRGDGKVGFERNTLNLDELKPKLAEIAQKTPDRPLTIKPGKKATQEQIDALTKLCQAAGFKSVTVAPQPTPKPATPAVPAAKTAEAAALVSTPAAPTPAPPPTPTSKPLPPAMELPLNLQLRPDGKVDFQNATLSLDDLKIKLEELSVISPGQSIVVNGSEKVSHKELKKVLALCREAKLKNVTVAKATPAPAGSVPTPAVAVAQPTTVASNPIRAKPSAAMHVSSESHAPVYGAPLSTGPEDTVP